MWSPTSICARGRILGRNVWPLSRTIVKPNDVVSRSFVAGRGLRKNCAVKDKPGKPVESCPQSCAKLEGTCSPKPKPCPRKPCLAPCHACPSNDPCWHCPYTPPLCPKKRGCCRKPVDNHAYKDVCCPPTNHCKKFSSCVPCEPPLPEPRRLTRCEQPGAMSDPCCSRSPKCPDPCAKNKPKEICDSDCPERPKPPNPCHLEGEICAEEPCEFKKPEKCCSETPARDLNCCPRRQKTVKKKRVIKNTCCLNLDPNWPPKRDYCDCEVPPKDVNTPCQQVSPKKAEFWDGL